MRRRLLLLALIAAGSGLAQPPDASTPPGDGGFIPSTEQPREYTSEIRNAILELSDCEQDLISGQEDGVDERLAWAQEVLGGAPADALFAAREALARGNRNEARALVNLAIELAEQAY